MSMLQEAAFVLSQLKRKAVGCPRSIRRQEGSACAITWHLTLPPTPRFRHTQENTVPSPRLYSVNISSLPLSNLATSNDLRRRDGEISSE